MWDIAVVAAFSGHRHGVGDVGCCAVASLQVRFGAIVTKTPLAHVRRPAGNTGLRQAAEVDTGLSPCAYAKPVHKHRGRALCLE